MRTSISIIACAISIQLLTACSPAATDKPTPTTKNASQSLFATESERANALFEQIYQTKIDRSPVLQAYLGINKDNDKWDDISDDFAKQSLEIAKQNLIKIESLDFSQLDQQTRISYDLAVKDINNRIADFKWRFHNYPVNQMYGLHASIPTLLITQHQINNVADAKAYISRLNGTVLLLEQLAEQLNIRAEMGIMAPKFVYPLVIDGAQKVITGAPFNEGEDSTLLADFSKKVDALGLSKTERDTLLKDAKIALIASVKPAFEQLIRNLSILETKANTDDGAWKFPEGDAFYRNALQRTTTTTLSPSEIHQIGLDEVSRIHQEMHDIMAQVGFEGDLQEFFKFMRTDPQFYLPETDEGKQQYLQQATALIDEMKRRLDELFIVKPKADMVVKQVESYREKAAGKAFYQQPAIDGSRPGMYYANLYRMSDMPIYQMEALAYHEGIPGHHMQIAIAQELKGVPKFRKYGRFTAYNEGWGLYSELLPKEIGMYQDPYSDFGRLAMEIWRACRLVVDTGIHSKKWTREEAIAYLKDNTPNPEGDVIKAIERYIVLPSQATAYKIGMIKIVELRQKAENALGNKFDIRQFHDVILKNGPLPLDVLETQVDKYITSHQTSL